MRLRRNPITQRRAANIVAEANHTRHGSPSMLAQPTIRTTRARASTSTTVRCTCVSIGETTVAREDGRGPEWVSEGENHGESVGIIRRVVVERVAILIFVKCG